MRVVLMILLFFSPALVRAEAATQCSRGQFGHSFCVRPAHFNFDLCHTLAAESARHGLDPGFFTRLVWQESRFDPNAVSPANAMGIAQFIASTAKLRDLRDPFNPAEALEASARYLAELTQEFGNPGLAAVAYNSGESRAARFLARQSGLPRETVNYVQIITGLPAETWRDTPPDGHDFRLDQAKSFIDACLVLASKRRITPLAKPVPRLKEWGVQLGFGTTKERARASVRRNTASCRSLVSKEKFDYVKVKNRVQGKAGYIMARISRNSRGSAAKLCQRLSRAGCRCRVYRN